MNTFGQRIAYYRKKAGLTQEELAEKCSVTPQAVSKWDNDISAHADAKKRRAIKKAFMAAKRQWSGLEIISVHSDDGEVVSIIL